MRIKVRFSPQALEQAAVARTWWCENRPLAPRLFQQELTNTLQQLRSSPLSGAPYPHKNIRGVRRMRLKGTQYHVYYLIEEKTITILALWSTRRGEEPGL